jgi:putative transposase
MLTAAQHQQWCLHLHLSPQASEAVTRVRSSPPVRRVGSRATNVSGTYASRKMGYAIQFESHTVELWAVYTMEYDPQVLEYYSCPHISARALCGARLLDLQRLLRAARTEKFPD